jgi:enediyne biosynthesis protein E4
LGGHPQVFVNRVTGNHWLTVKLTGTHCNREGLGAKVKANNQWGYATTSGSYLSASDGRVHFGLGSDDHASIDITWPCGRRQHLDHVPAGHILTVTEPQ